MTSDLNIEIMRERIARAMKLLKQDDRTRVAIQTAFEELEETETILDHNSHHFNSPDLLLAAAIRTIKLDAINSARRLNNLLEGVEPWLI